MGEARGASLEGIFGALCASQDGFGFPDAWPRWNPHLVAPQKEPGLDLNRPQASAGSAKAKQPHFYNFYTFGANGETWTRHFQPYLERETTYGDKPKLCPGVVGGALHDARGCGA